MTLLEKLKADQLTARKNKSTVAISLLTTLIGDAVMVGKNDGNRETTDAEVITTIKKFLKNVDENLKIAGQRNDFNWCDLLMIEQKILSDYLPQQMTGEQIMSALTGGAVAKNKGECMKFLKSNFAGKYDGLLASQIVDAYLKS